MFRTTILIIPLLAGCFDGSSDAAPSACEQMVQTLCARACECADVECYHFLDAWSATYTSEAACESAELALWCEDTGLEMDFDGCEAAVAGAECGEDYGQTGLPLPTACEAMVSY